MNIIKKERFDFVKKGGITFSENISRLINMNSIWMAHIKS